MIQGVNPWIEVDGGVTPSNAYKVHSRSETLNQIASGNMPDADFVPLYCVKRLFLVVLDWSSYLKLYVCDFAPSRSKFDLQREAYLFMLIGG